MVKRPRGPKYRITHVRQWREHRKLTTEELADAAGTTHATISRLERGLHPYKQPLFEKIAAALNCTPGDLLTRGPTEAQPLALWEKIKPDQRERALRALRAFIDDEA